MVNATFWNIWTGFAARFVAFARLGTFFAFAGFVAFRFFFAAMVGDPTAKHTDMASRASHRFSFAGANRRLRYSLCLVELFERIRANLDDDDPRLVYADALQDLGDPRGELIAVQCE